MRAGPDRRPQSRLSFRTTAAGALDLDRLRAWIGKAERAVDVVTPSLVQRFNATLNQEGTSLRHGAIAPPLIHWCLPPPASATTALTPDGHPRRGSFLPPVPLPRRMWAGGRLEFLSPIRIGDAIRRQSRIADISLKHGRSGRLCFVAVEHEISTDGGTAIRERQDIVFRDPAVAGTSAPEALPPAVDVAATPAHRQERRTDAALLFRYSALTFNAHRIHYDRDYAREEGYAGLVVHGPLQATIAMAMWCRLRGYAPGTFEFRALRPLIEGAFTLSADEEPGWMRFRLADGSGEQTLAAVAEGHSFDLDRSMAEAGPDA